MNQPAAFATRQNVFFVPLFAVTCASLALLAPLGASGQTSGSPTHLPDVLVTTNAIPVATEEATVGPYQQPEWTTERRFPGTRIYLQQTPWDCGVEQWVRHQNFRDGTAETRFQEEFELGLPRRFQLDLYETWSIDQDRQTHQDEYSAELRYALADWGKIPLNPTFYLEYARHQRDPNTIEGKLLLGTDLSPDWHWGLNLACEQGLSRERNTELAVSQGASYTLIDHKVSAGVEMEFFHEKAKGTPEQYWFLIGPSVQWRPTSWSHVDLAPLIGCTHDSPRVEAYLVIGFDFDTGSKKEQRYAPTSIRSN